MLMFSPLSSATQTQLERPEMWRKHVLFLIPLFPSLWCGFIHCWGKKEGLEKTGKALSWLTPLVPVCVLCIVNNQMLAWSGRILSGLIFSGSADPCCLASCYLWTPHLKSCPLGLWPERWFHLGYCQHCPFHPPLGCTCFLSKLVLRAALLLNQPAISVSFVSPSQFRQVQRLASPLHKPAFNG